MLLRKNACSSLVYGPIFKISLVPETREQALQYIMRILILQICQIREIKSHAKFSWFTVFEIFLSSLRLLREGIEDGSSN